MKEGAGTVGRMTFGRVEEGAWGGYRQFVVYVDGREIGVVYREDGMDEWAADVGIEEIYGENVGCGHDRVRDVQRDLRQAHAEHVAYGA